MSSVLQSVFSGAAADCYDTSLMCMMNFCIVTVCIISLKKLVLETITNRQYKFLIYSFCWRFSSHCCLLSRGAPIISR